MAPPFHARQKRRGSNEAGPSTRNVRSRTVPRTAPSQSTIRSGSRYTTTSRRSSAESLRGRGRQRGPVRRPSARSERPVSVASSRTFAGDADERSATATEQQNDAFGADLDSLDEVVMAVNLTDRGTVGCAYYVAREEKLYFMEDVKLGGADIVDARTLLSIFAVPVRD